MDYDSYEDAIAADRALEFWMPQFVPMNSKRLRFAMVPDRNELWFQFTFPESERQNLSDGYDTVDATEIVLPRAGPTRDISWWPDSLSRGSASLAQYELFCVSAEASLHSLDRACDGFLAVERHGPRAWYWNVRN